MADETISKADMDKAIKDAVSAAREEWATETEGLKNKNRELIGKLRDAQGVKPEDLAAAEARADKAEAALAETTKQVKSLTTERDKAAKALEDATEAGRAFARDAALSGAIAKGSIVPDLAEAYLAFADKRAVTEMKDGKWTTTIDGKDAAAWVEEHLASDAGKHFKAAPVNGGGGAPGGGGQGASKTATRAQFDAMSHQERSTFAKDGGKVVEAA